MKKPQNIKIKLIALAVGLTIIPISYAGWFEPNPKVPSHLKEMPYEKWQDTESGRFAHSLKYEDKLAKPVPYSFTRSKDYEKESIDYFEHLCKTEGKDYIYRTATNVDSVAQLRSFEIPFDKSANPSWGPQSYKFHPYALESPVFFDESLSGEMYIRMHDNQQAMQFVNFGAIRAFYAIGYTNYEVKFNNGDIYSYKRDISKLIQLRKEEPKLKENELDKQVNSVEKLDKISAKYGFTWKGFSRPKDRDYGIAGGDLIVIDLEKNEIMAIQRTFIKGNIQRNSPTLLNWEGVGCFEQYKNQTIIHKDLNLEGKSFNEKVNAVRGRPPTSSYIPAFLHKIIKGE